MAGNNGDSGSSRALGSFRVLARQYAPFDTFLATTKPSRKHKFLRVFQDELRTLQSDSPSSLASPYSGPCSSTSPSDGLISSQLAALHERHRQFFGDWLAELKGQFHVLFYGFGAKRPLIDDWLRYCSDFNCASAVVDLTAEDVDLGAIEEAYQERQESIDLFLVVILGLEFGSHKAVAKLIHFCQSAVKARLVTTVDTVQCLPLFPVIQRALSLVMHDLTTFVSYPDIMPIDKSKQKAGTGFALSGGEVELEARGRGTKKSLQACKAILASMPAKTLRLFRLMVEAQLPTEKGQGQLARLKSRSEWAQEALNRFWISRESQLNVKELLDHELLVEVDALAELEAAAPKKRSRKRKAPKHGDPTETGSERLLRVNLEDAVLSALLPHLPSL